MVKHQLRETHIDEDGNMIHFLYMYDEVVFTTRDKQLIHDILWNEDGSTSTDEEIMEKVKIKIRKGEGE